MSEIFDKTKGFGFIFLMISLIFLIPMNVGVVFAGNNKDILTKTNEQAGKDCNIFPPIDVKDSIILSAATLCLPGLLEKANDYRQIKCQEVVCSYNAVVSSIQPTHCTKQASYRVCKYFVGEFTALPYLNLADGLREIVANILANPQGYLYSVFIAYIRKDKCVGDSCNSLSPQGVKQIILGLNDIAAGVQTFKDMIDNGFWPDFNDEDYCDKIDEIETKLKEVVAGVEEEDNVEDTSSSSSSETDTSSESSSNVENSSNT